MSWAFSSYPGHSGPLLALIEFEIKLCMVNFVPTAVSPYTLCISMKLSRGLVRVAPVPTWTRMHIVICESESLSLPLNVRSLSEGEFNRKKVAFGLGNILFCGDGLLVAPVSLSGQWERVSFAPCADNTSPGTARGPVLP